MVSKNVLRADILTARSQLGSDKTSQFSRDICKNVLFVFAEAGDVNKKPIWAAYKSFRWEADPSEAVFQASPYVRWVYPRVTGETSMEFLEPAATDALWVKNKWGLWEPDPRTSAKVDLQDVSGVLVPGVAFDRGGRRLGYGKGFYDRALAGFQGLKVGIAFSLQVMSQSLPVDENDVAMDMIVTESEIIKVEQQHKATSI